MLITSMAASTKTFLISMAVWWKKMLATKDWNFPQHDNILTNIFFKSGKKDGCFCLFVYCRYAKTVSFCNFTQVLIPVDNTGGV